MDQTCEDKGGVFREPIKQSALCVDSVSLYFDWFGDGCVTSETRDNVFASRNYSSGLSLCLL